MSNTDGTDKKKKAPSSFDGRPNFSDVFIGPMDDGPETTRRVETGAGICMEPMTAPIGGATRMYDASLRGTRISKADASPPVRLASTVGRFAWKLQDVPTLPELYPLERTAVFTEQTSPATITERISNVLWERSIEAEYDDEKAKASCVTPEGVECRVRLYRGRGKYNHGVIVEVQRRFGSSTNFQKHVSAILDAAEGRATPPPPLSAMGCSGDALPLVSDTEEEGSPVSGADSLKMVEKMMNHGYDSQYLALQTLSSLTDATKMGAGTARAVASELLAPENVVGGRVFDLLNTKDEDEGFKLRVMAISIVANALAAVSGKCSQVIREILRPILLQELAHADSNPRSAQMAARCFEYLFPGDHDHGEIAAALEKAHAVGAARHAGLYQQTKRCLDKILM